MGIYQRWDTITENSRTLVPDFEKSLSFMLGDLQFGTHLPEGVEILLGEYREIGKNHGKPVFRRSDAHHHTVATDDWFILDPNSWSYQVSSTNSLIVSRLLIYFWSDIIQFSQRQPCVCYLTGSFSHRKIFPHLAGRGTKTNRTSTSISGTSVMDPSSPAGGLAKLLEPHMSLSGDGWVGLRSLNPPVQPMINSWYLVVSEWWSTIIPNCNILHPLVI